MSVAVAGFGEGAALVELGVEEASDRAARTHAAAAALRARFPKADVVAGAGAVLVDGADRDEVRAAIDGGALAAITSPPPGRSHVIRTVYDGPDLDEAAATLGIAREALIALHAGREYTVELLGFLPGFGYLGPLDPRLVLPRRSAPRPSVPARSVAVAGGFTGVYPFASPGGWNLLGRAIDFEPFDPAQDPPIFFAPGDRVRFSPVDAGEAIEVASPPPAHVEATHGLEVITAAGVTIQDGGRAGWLSRGLPPSGALDRAALAAANRAVGNDAGAAAFEAPLGVLTLRARGEAVISVDGEPPITLAAGETFKLPKGPRPARYIAARGGVDVPVVLGARSTLLVAKMGGFEGRPLRRGDVIPIGDDRACDAPAPSSIDADPIAPIAITPGPHLARFPAGALDALLAAEWRVSRLADRVGVRLEGAKIPRDRPDLALPLPMLRGAVQVTTDGTPIVLGPDHPTTGGYPVIAILGRDAQDRLARRRPGDAVRFTLA